MGNETEKKENFLVKFLKGVKNFFVKTGRVNGSNCYGIIEGIGDFLVYEDHALISAVGMDDVVFKRENVISSSFEGLGRIRRNKATVQYTIVLDDTVVFPEKVREKNDVKNLKATVDINKLAANKVGKGSFEAAADCDIYAFGPNLVIVMNLEKPNGDKVMKYQESVLYPNTDVEAWEEADGNKFRVKFNDGKRLSFVAKNETVFNEMKEFFKAE